MFVLDVGVNSCNWTKIFIWIQHVAFSSRYIPTSKYRKGASILISITWEFSEEQVNLIEISVIEHRQQLKLN